MPEGLFGSGMIGFILGNAIIAAEINLAAFVFDDLILADLFAGNWADGIRFDGFAIFLGHLGDKGFGILLEFADAAFAARIDVLAQAGFFIGVFDAVLFDDRAAADRAHLIGDVLLF